MKPLSEIEQALVDDLAKHHERAQDLIRKANQAIKDAAAESVYCGQLVEKISRSKKLIVFQFIAEHISIDGLTSRSYKLAHFTSKKRKVESDRRCMLKLGIIDQQAKGHAEPRKVKTPLSLSTTVRRAAESIAKGLEKRPVVAMSADEKLMLKGQLENVARVYVELSKGGR